MYGISKDEKTYAFYSSLISRATPGSWSDNGPTKETRVLVENAGKMRRRW